MVKMCILQEDSGTLVVILLQIKQKNNNLWLLFVRATSHILTMTQGGMRNNSASYMHVVHPDYIHIQQD